MFKACRITVQKFLYGITSVRPFYFDDRGHFWVFLNYPFNYLQVACLWRGMLFSLSDSSLIPERLYKPALCTYYALITSSLALIVCYWCEIFFTEDAAQGAAKRYEPKFFVQIIIKY